jgi:hypothetical protein
MNRLDRKERVQRILDGTGPSGPASRAILSQSDVEALVSRIRLSSH